MLYELLRPSLFKADPEEAHERVIGLLEKAQKVPGVLSFMAGAAPEGLETEVFGLRFPNPIGLAAGFDKQCRVIPALGSLGFGFIEAGSVTLRPQPGNEKPRIFRLPEHEALINRLGFNSEGAEACSRRLSGLGEHAVPLGINLGINKDCPKDHAPQEYSLCFKRLAEHGDYFVVNVSSPNTGGLRELQEKLRLKKILTAIQAQNAAKKPLLVKIAPDLDDADLQDIVGIVSELASGIVATNTTVARDMLPADVPEIRGGLSGAPLRERATRMITKIFKMTEGKLPIIGVGGVFSGADALDKIRAGASLVQIYTGFVYRGPSAAVLIQRELKGLMAARGFKTVAEAVGTGAQEAVA